jgi:hypothetical protein
VRATARKASACSSQDDTGGAARYHREDLGDARVDAAAYDVESLSVGKSLKENAPLLTVGFLTTVN